MPLVLDVGVKLTRTSIDRGVQAGAVAVVPEISLKTLLNAGRDSGKLHNRLLQRRKIKTRVYAAAPRNVVESPFALALVKEHHRRQNAAAEEAAAIVVLVEAEVEPGADRLRSMHPAQVVNKLV